MVHSFPYSSFHPRLQEMLPTKLLKGKQMYYSFDINLLIWRKTFNTRTIEASNSTEITGRNINTL